MTQHTFTLGHLSDVHLGPLPRLGPRHWNPKRLLGFANWVRHRRMAHLPGTLQKIVADLLLQAPDHIAVTGDLVNIGLPDEYEAAGRWLELLGPPDRVSAVPGNHDIYTRMSPELGVGRWAAYMRGDDRPAGACFDLDVFPYLRRRGRVSLIGLNSAIPTPVFRAYGRLGGPHLERLAEMLDAERRRGALRVVLIHHPPLAHQASPAKRLTDAVHLEAVLGRHGADLVLHGHNHTASLIEYPAAGRIVNIAGVPSASLVHARGHETLARYNLYRISSDADERTSIEMVSRGLAEPGGDVIEIERRVLRLG